MKKRASRYRVSMRDPGLDRHDWQTEWEALEEQLEDAPGETLPEVGDLVERMLLEAGIPIEDEVANHGIEPELLVDYRSAREITRRLERGEDVDPGDIGEAVHHFRDIYGYLIADRSD